MNGNNCCSSIFCFVFARQLCENFLHLVGRPFLIKAMFPKSKHSTENRPAHQSSVLEPIFGAGFRNKHVIFLKCMSVAGCLAKSLGLLYLFLAGAGLGLGSAALQSCSAAEPVLHLLCWKGAAWPGCRPGGSAQGGKTLKTSQNKIRARYLEFLQFYLEDGAHLMNPVLPHE